MRWGSVWTGREVREVSWGGGGRDVMGVVRAPDEPEPREVTVWEERLAGAGGHYEPGAQVMRGS